MVWCARIRALEKIPHREIDQPHIQTILRKIPNVLAIVKFTASKAGRGKHETGN
jgi:hypothetical protein